MYKKDWDIFCKIVDNFGDIGICWRLSNQLAYEHQLNVRLFIDDYQMASKIISNLSTTPFIQSINGIQIMPWNAADITPAGVVVENFSSQLPEHYVEKIRSQLPNQSTIWINLEYLTAEKWVDEYHGLPSKHPNSGIQKNFFFPGFTQKTGGLLREADLLKIRDHFLQHPNIQNDFWQKILGQFDTQFLVSSINISLFCYPQADIRLLLNALSLSKTPINLFLPMTSELSNSIDDLKLTLGQVTRIGHLQIHCLPFLSQTDYDQLLWACDLNFVRGEDSWVRAIWAGKPFVWQPYIQDEEAHIQKLNAFLAVYAKNAATDIQIFIRESHLVWSQATPYNWLSFIESLPKLTPYSFAQSKQFSSQTSLSTQLVQYVSNLRQ